MYSVILRGGSQVHASTGSSGWDKRGGLLQTIGLGIHSIIAFDNAQQHLMISRVVYCVHVLMHGIGTVILVCLVLSDSYMGHLSAASSIGGQSS